MRPMTSRRWLILGGLLLPGTLSAALLVHLPFDRDGSDVSGHRRHAQPHNGAAVDPTSSRLGGGAAAFDGLSAFYNLPAFTPVEGNGPRSVSLWVRSDQALRSKPNVVFCGWGTTSRDPGVRFDLALENEDDTRLRVEFNLDFVVSTAQHVNFCDGKWHHLVVTYDGEAVRFHVDGRAYGKPVKVREPLRTGRHIAGMVIGAGVREGTGLMGRNERFFAGWIDDLGIWNRALTAEEVALLHGLAAVGDNDLRWLEAAAALWQRPVGATARINGHTWRRVNGLRGEPGDWMRVVTPNGAGSFVVLDAQGGGLQITPFWWEEQLLQSLGLVAAVAAGFAGLVWLAVHVRWRVQMRRIEARERRESERRRIAQDLHDDLGSGLTEIISLGDLAERECRTPDELKARLADMTRKTRDLVGAVDEIVWTANPVNDVVPKLAGYLCDYAERFLRAKDIRCRLEVAEQLPSLPVNAKARHHLLMAVKEALNNAVKHSGASEVWLRIHSAGDELCIRIEDNGCGFDPAAASHGNGLINLRSRLSEVGGRTEIEAAPGQGVKVSFRLTLKGAAP